MTEKILLELGIDINNAEVTLEQLQKQLKEANKEFSKAAVGSKAYNDAAVKVKALDQAVKTVKGSAKDARNSLGGINEAAKTTAGSMEDLEQQIKGARKELYQMVLGSKEYEDQLKKVNDLEDKRVGFKMKEKSLFQERVAAGVGGAMGKAQGAANALNNSLLGVVSIAKFMGLDDIEDAIDGAFKYISSFFKNVYQGAMDFLRPMGQAFSEFFSGNFTAAWELTKVGFKEMTNVFTKAHEAGTESYKVQVKINEEMDKLSTIEKERKEKETERIKSSIALRKKGVDDETIAIKNAIKAADDEYKAANKKLAVYQNIVDLTKKQIDAEMKQNKTQEMSDSQRERLREAELQLLDARNTALKIYETTITKANNKAITTTKENTDAVNENADAQKKAAEEKAKIEQENQQRLDATNRLEEETRRKRIQLNDNERQRGLDLLQFDAEKEKERIQNSMADLWSKAEASRLVDDQLLKDKERFIKEMDAKDKALKDADKQRTEETEQAKRDAIFTTLNATAEGINAIGQLMGRNNKFQKAAALFQIGTNMAQAISAAVKESAENPANSTTFGLAGVAQFAAMTAQILVGIAQAKSVLTEPPASFAVGGFTGNTGTGFGYDYQGNEVAGIVHTNEMVFNAKQANDLHKTMGAVRAMLGGKNGKGIAERIEVNIVDIARVSANSNRVKQAAKL